MDEVKKQRTIRSFVKRTGRMTEGQRKALADRWSAWGLSVAAGKLNYCQIFGRDAPVILEIGFGMGGSLVEMARETPECNFIGIEVHEPGVGKLFHLMQQRDVDNIRAYCDDAVEVLQYCIPDHSLARIQIYFPDPWHKKKHHKRRLVQSAFVQTLRTKLKEGGVVHLATDWEHYAEYMMEVMTAAEGFENCVDPYCFAPRPDFRPVTKFETRGQHLGHGVWDLMFQSVSLDA